MTHWKQLTVALLVGAIAAGSGVAFASGFGDNGPAAPVRPFVQAFGGNVNETRFVPIAPCRIVDTRVAGGPFTPGQVRHFQVRGTGSTFAAQGGTSGGCGIPTSGVTAIDVTVTAVGGSGAGYLRVYPNSEPKATFLNYTSGFNPSNTGTVALCGYAGGLCVVHQDITVKDYTASTQVVMDIGGYFTKPLSITVDQNATIVRGSRDVSVSKLPSVGTYLVVFDRNVSECSYFATIGAANSGNPIGQVSATGSISNPNGVFVATTDSTGALSARPFHLDVIC